MNRRHSFLFENRTDVEWIKLSTHLNDYDYKLDYAEKDGYCFISSLQKCL